MSMVLEFVGLPGVGKSTIASHVTTKLRDQGIEPLVTQDFVEWLGRLGRKRKLKIVLTGLPVVIRQFLAAARFGFSMKPQGFRSLKRLLLIPFVNRCFDVYVEAHPGRIIIMDQANMQLLWSLGAFCKKFDPQALGAACQATAGNLSPLYVSVAATPSLVAERLGDRSSCGSRFDGLSETELRMALTNSARVLARIHEYLIERQESVVVVNADAFPEENADLICK